MEEMMVRACKMHLKVLLTFYDTALDFCYAF